MIVYQKNNFTIFTTKITQVVLSTNQGFFRTVDNSWEGREVEIEWERFDQNCNLLPKSQWIPNVPATELIQYNNDGTIVRWKYDPIKRFFIKYDK